MTLSDRITDLTSAIAERFKQVPSKLSVDYAVARPVAGAALGTLPQGYPNSDNEGSFLTEGDRVLIYDNGQYSGIWIVRSGVWARAGDANYSTLLAGAIVHVDGGDNAGTIWVNTGRGTSGPEGAYYGPWMQIAKAQATSTPDATKFLRGDNTWAVPTGSGAGGVSTATTGLDLNVANNAPASPSVHDLWVDFDEPSPSTTITASGVVAVPLGTSALTVNFPTNRFTTAPVVTSTVGVGSNVALFVNVGSITASSCIFYFYAVGGSWANGNTSLHWHASVAH